MTINHPRFSNAKRITRGNTTLMTTSINTSERNFEKWRSALAERNVKADKQRFLLLPADANDFGNTSEGGCCSSRKSTEVNSP